jgi:hypothetical protein
MDTYRSAAKPEHRTLDLRLEPFAIAILFVFVAPFFIVPGALFAFGMLQTLASQITLTAILMALAGIVFAGLGALLAYVAYRIFTTRVRFIVTPEELVVEWRRLGKVLKTEKVPLGDVVDIAVSDEPSSGDERYYGLVLGTRLGDITLTDGKASQEWGYIESRKKLAAFLQVPER